MTTGQRIALKRKECNLSQEALGEELGVSRQSISKWESDVSLPEIDKLVALSKLFAVSVGWLLGVEEQGAEQDPSDSGKDSAWDGELSGAQVKMVEEIVSRYIAAQPKRKTLSPRRRILLKICVAAAAICLAIGMIRMANKLDNLDNQYSNLQNSMNNVTYNVNNQIGSIANRVEEVLKAQNNLTAAYEARWVSRDLRANTVTITASAVPKTYREGMTAVFTVDSGGEMTEHPAVQEGQTFSAEITCTLTDNIDVSVVFLHGDVRETQLLENFSGLYHETIPECYAEDSWQFDEATWANGVLTIPAGDLFLRDYWADHVEKGVCADIAEIRVGIFKNRELAVWAEQVPKPDHYHGFEDCIFFAYTGTEIPFDTDDVLQLATVVTDEYGRTTVRGGSEWMLESIGEVSAGAAAGEEIPMDLEEFHNAGYYRYDDPADWGL